jgi:hypothetical protein
MCKIEDFIMLLFLLWCSISDLRTKKIPTDHYESYRNYDSFDFYKTGNSWYGRRCIDGSDILAHQ